MSFSIVDKLFLDGKLDPRHHELGGFLDHGVLGIQKVRDAFPEALQPSQSYLPQSGRFQPDVILLQQLPKGRFCIKAPPAQ